MEGQGADQIVVIAVDHSQHAEDAVKCIVPQQKGMLIERKVILKNNLRQEFVGRVTECLLYTADYLDKMHRKGNKLMLVHCVELPEMNRNVARDCHISPAVLASMWKEEEAKSRVLEGKMKQLLTNRGVSAKLRSCAGKPGEMICRIAEEQKAAYIVTGTRGGSSTVGQRGSVGAALQQTIVGGVSDYLLRHASCPVVVCRDAESIRRQRHASEGKARRRHQSAKAGPSTAGSETFASSFRKRFLSGGKESSSIDVVDEVRSGSSAEGQGLLGKDEAMRRSSGAMASVDLPILFHSSVQLYPSSTSPPPAHEEPVISAPTSVVQGGPQAVAVKN